MKRYKTRLKNNIYVSFLVAFGMSLPLVNTPMLGSGLVVSELLIGVFRGL